jgi:hypothetical protein
MAVRKTPCRVGIKAMSLVIKIYACITKRVKSMILVRKVALHGFTRPIWRSEVVQMVGTKGLRSWANLVRLFRKASG